MTYDPGNQWSDEELDLLTPDMIAVRLAKQFVAGWATGDRQVLDSSIEAAITTGRHLRFLGALAELIVQGTGLRDNPATLAELRREVAEHLADEENH